MFETLCVVMVFVILTLIFMCAEERERSKKLNQHVSDILDHLQGVIDNTAIIAAGATKVSEESVIYFKKIAEHIEGTQESPPKAKKLSIVKKEKEKDIGE